MKSESDFDLLFKGYHSKVIRFCTVMHNLERRLTIIGQYPLVTEKHEKIINDTKEGYGQLKAELDICIEQYKSIKREENFVAYPSNHEYLKTLNTIIDFHLLQATKSLALIERTTRKLKIPEHLDNGLIWEPPSNGRWKIATIAFFLGLIIGWLITL